MLMLAAFVACIFTGYPVAFTLAGIGVLFAFIGDIRQYFSGRWCRGFTAESSPLAPAGGAAVHLHGADAGKVRHGGNLLLTLERLLGRMRGGLALSVALLGIIMAASTGIVGASVVLLGVIGLPVMLRQGYKKELAAGVTAASGTLGILIPPSIMLVFMGAILQISVGDLFKAALVPGLLLGDCTFSTFCWSARFARSGRRLRRRKTTGEIWRCACCGIWRRRCC